LYFILFSLVSCHNELVANKRGRCPFVCMSNLVASMMHFRDICKFCRPFFLQVHSQYSKCFRKGVGNANPQHSSKKVQTIKKSCQKVHESESGLTRADKGSLKMQSDSCRCCTYSRMPRDMLMWQGVNKVCIAVRLLHFYCYQLSVYFVFRNGLR
jgi:hypothetical protein